MSQRYHDDDTVQSHRPNLKIDYETLFHTLQVEIANYAHMIQSVQNLKRKIEDGMSEGVFDAEDLNWVDHDVQLLCNQKTQKEHEYQQKMQIYQTSVLKLEQIIDKRKQILESADQQWKVFDNRPNLLQNFAQKNASLVKLIEQGKKELNT